MKYVKTLGLAAIALLAFTGTASATYLTSPAGSTYTGPITLEGSATSFEHPSEFPTFFPVTCKSSKIEGMVEQHGASVTASGKVSKFSFSECSDSVTVLQPGSLEIHKTSVTGNGTVTSSGAEIRLHTSEGPVCTVKTSSTDIGFLIGSNLIGGKATMDIGASSLPMTGVLCPSLGRWTGDYTVTTPSTLEVH
jgi:hypothetical protein